MLPRRMPASDAVHVGKGVGHCPGHFGELLQGEFSDTENGATRGLVTLPLRTVGVTCTLRLTVGSGAVVSPPGKVKAASAIALALGEIDEGTRYDVVADFVSDIPVGIGMGSSTADIVAALRALTVALGRPSCPNEISAWAVRAEVASDSLAFGGECVLFAQRAGHVIERFAGPVPKAIAVGFDLDPGCVFDTVGTPPAQYSRDEIDEFDALRHAMRGAVAVGDPVLLASIATRSAELNQRHFPKKRFADLLDLMRRHRALGASIAHSGTIGALLLDVATPKSRLGALAAEAREAGLTPICTFWT